MLLQNVVLSRNASVDETVVRYWARHVSRHESLPILTIGLPLHNDQYGQLLLEVLRPFALRIAETLPLSLIFQRAHIKGVSGDDLENALIDATAQGWVSAIGDNLALTTSGHRLVYPANDNGSRVA
jgi:hypothetical protein